MEKYDLIIIGGGIVGLSAGLYAGRLNISTAIFAKELRGTLIKTHVVENYPGFESISGFELVERVLKQVKNYDVDLFSKEVVDIKKVKNGFKIHTVKDKYFAKNILFATGSQWRRLEVPGEVVFKNKGVHYCAICDGGFYKDKTVAIIGGSDSAAKEALLLSKYAKKVYMIIRSHLKAEPINAQRVKDNDKVNLLEGINIKEIKGEDKVNSIVLTKEHKGKKEINVDGVFVDIGQIPNSKLAKEMGVKLNKKSEIIIDKESKTNMKNIYAAGDVTDSKFKQAITGVGEGIKAIYEIYNDLE